MSNGRPDGLTGPDIGKWRRSSFTAHRFSVHTSAHLFQHFLLQYFLVLPCKCSRGFTGGSFQHTTRPFAATASVRWSRYMAANAGQGSSSVPKDKLPQRARQQHVHNSHHSLYQFWNHDVLSVHSLQALHAPALPRNSIRSGGTNAVCFTEAASAKQAGSGARREAVGGNT